MPLQMSGLWAWPNLIIGGNDREEKSLPHIAMVAKFLRDNKSKRHLKSGFPPFQTSSISFNLSNVGEVLWVELERTVSKFRKRKFLYCSHLLDKAGE